MKRKYRFSLWCQGVGGFAMRATSADAARRQFRRRWPHNKGHKVKVIREKRQSLEYIRSMEAWLTKA